MQQKDPGLTKDVISAVENAEQFVNQEQLIAAALFAKQLQADITGIKRASVDNSLKVTPVDMSKVMPSNIYKTFRPVNPGSSPNRSPAPESRVTYIPPPPEIKESPITLPIVQTEVPKVEDSQIEFDFDKKIKAEDLMNSIDNLEKKIILLDTKLDTILDILRVTTTTRTYKKKPKTENLDGTQTG